MSTYPSVVMGIDRKGKEAPGSKRDSGAPSAGLLLLLRATNAWSGYSAGLGEEVWAECRAGVLEGARFESLLLRAVGPILNRSPDVIWPRTPRVPREATAHVVGASAVPWTHPCLEGQGLRFLPGRRPCGERLSLAGLGRRRSPGRQLHRVSTPQSAGWVADWLWAV